MKIIDVVIGLNYGDEGKGLVTDFLASKSELDSTVVIRHNGGAQAGHTVTLDDGRRHVFHQLGAGSFAGAVTHLSKFFVVNPIMFFEEATAWVNHSPNSKLTVLADPAAQVTTPYDVFINQEIERRRGDSKHGSCGMGINETIERAERGFPLTVRDLSAPDLEEKLQQIRSEYFPERLEELGIFDSNLDVLAEADARFLSDATDFLDVVEMFPDESIVDTFDRVIFEGAQGLCLDQYSQDFPHVTRSSTGLENVSFILDHITNAVINVYYVSRTYLTRHGAGPLKNEVDISSDHDKTNVTNEFQGQLRFAPLDYKRIARDVEQDLEHVANHTVNVHAVLTWCDTPLLSSNDAVSEIIVQFGNAVGTDSILTSWGPTRNSIMEA